MKKLLLLTAISFLLFSCGKSHEEEMLYNYQKDKMKKNINMDIDDLDFEISEIKKIEEIKASDSAKIYKEKLMTLWYSDNVRNDTLSYDFVLTELDTLKNRYQQIILANIKSDRAYENYDWKDKRDQMIDAIYDVKDWKESNDKYVENPDMVLSTKYEASYSINNPMLNNSKQSFSKLYYSDSNNKKFIKEESID